LGLSVVNDVHQLVVGDFKPDLTIILDVPDAVALERANARGGVENRFERKGAAYHQRVRQAFIEIAASDSRRYALVDGSASMDQVTASIQQLLKDRLQLRLG
jgi:dTMP kinase